MRSTTCGLIFRCITAVLLSVCVLGCLAQAADECPVIAGDANLTHRSFTIPTSSIVAGAASAFEPITGVLMNIAGGVLTDLVLPDLKITFSTSINGTMEVDYTCAPGFFCDEGSSLMVGAVVELQGTGEWHNPSIPPSIPLTWTNTIRVEPVRDGSLGDRRRAIPKHVKADFSIPLSGMRADLVFAVGSTPYRIPDSSEHSVSPPDLSVNSNWAEGDGIPIEYSGWGVGELDESPPVIVWYGCDPDDFDSQRPSVSSSHINVPIGGQAPFHVSASDPDCAGDNLHFYFVPMEEWLEIEWERDPSDPHIIHGVFTIAPDAPVSDNETIEVGVQVYDLAVKASSVSGRPTDGQYRDRGRGTLYVTCVGNRWPHAYAEPVSISSAELQDALGCKVEAIVSAEDPDLPANYGYELRFFPITWSAGLACDTAALGEGGIGILGSCTGTSCRARFGCWLDCSTERATRGTYSMRVRVIEQRVKPGGTGEIEYGFYDDVVWTLEVTNSPPTARDDDEDNISDIGEILSTIAVDVLDNDDDPDDDPLIPRLDEEPQHGTLSYIGDGVFVYAPDEGFEGTDRFTYYASDGWSDSAETATVTLTVHAGARNRAPSLEVSLLEENDCPDELGGGDDCERFLVRMTDPDLNVFWLGEVVSLSAIAGIGTRALLSGFGDDVWVESVEIDGLSPALGVLAVRVKQSAGESQVKLLATDGEETASARLKFMGNSSPQVSFDEGATWTDVGVANYDGELSISDAFCWVMDPAWFESGCLQFRDEDGDSLDIFISKHPTRGTANLTTTIGSGGVYYVTVLYEVDREEWMECHRNRIPLIDQVKVSATDGSGTAVGEMNFRIDVVNSPPTCEDDSATTTAGVPVTIDVLDNDSDPDEDVLTIVEVSVPAGGGAAIVNDEIVYTPDPNVCGEDTFSYTVDDDYGGQTTAWVAVEVIDSVPPDAICQTATLYLDANGTATLDPASLNDNSTDNCSIATFDASEKTFNCGMLGDRPVMLTVYDSAGNSDSCWTTVSVLDKINPVAVGQDITVQLDSNGSVTVQASEINGGSTDNCSVTTVLIDGNVEKVFSCGDIGAKTVSLTVRDQSGNEHSVDVMVTVEDPIAPVAQCQDIIASLDINGEVTVAASSIDNGSTDNCSIASMTLDRDFFTEADIGDQTVTLTVEDASGNTDSCTAVVTVQDNMAPDIDCPGAKFVQVDLNRCYATGVDLGMPTATDNTEVDWLTLTNNAPSQFQVGTTAVKWAVSDIYGNVGQCFQQVTVTESVDPTVSCPGDIDVDTGDPTGTTVTFAASATDNCDPSPEITFSPTSGSHFPIGDTVVTVTATDDSGNTDTCTFTVSVNFQNSPPNAVNDSASLAQGEGYVDIPVLNNDRDPEGHDLTITDVGDPQCGITTIIGDEIRYGTLGCASLPDEVTFTYEITDEHGATDTAVVTVDLPGGAPLNNND